MNAAEVDNHLDSVTNQMLTWKPGLTTNIARTVVEHMLRDRIAYTDEVDLDYVATAD